MKKLLLSFCAILALLSTVSVQARENEKTTQIVKTIETSKLRGVKIYGGFDVTLKQGVVSSAVISVSSKLQPYLVAEVKNGILVLGLENMPDELQNESWREKSLRKAEITITSFDQIHASSLTSINCVGEFSTDDVCEITVSSLAKVYGINLTAKGIKIEASSLSEVVISGTVDNVVVNASSKASVDLSELKAKNVRANASSMSEIKCFATQSLNADASSMSKIRYATGGESISLSANSSSMGSVGK